MTYKEGVYQVILKGGSKSAPFKISSALCQKQMNQKLYFFLGIDPKDVQDIVKVK
jgi:hypothetical protein